MQSGEIIADSNYKELHVFGGSKRLALEVTFQDDADQSALRNQSLIELLTEHLIPKAISEGYAEVSIWETIVEGKVGPDNSLFSAQVSAGIYENYDFKLGERWIWEQTAGPEIDATMVDLIEFTYSEELDLFSSELFPVTIEGGTYFQVWLNVDGASVQKSIEKANEFFRKLSGCQVDGVPIDTTSFLGRQNAIALRIYIIPHVISSPFQHQPRMALTYGHEKGVAHCYTVTSDESGTWNDLYSALSE